MDQNSIKLKYSAIYKGLFFIIVTCLFFPKTVTDLVDFHGTGPAWLTLDASWQLGLNWAFINNKTFGTDIIFTYGPLGFLSTRLGFGINKSFYLLCDIFFLSNILFIINYFVKKVFNIKVVFVLLIGILCLDKIHGVNVGFIFLIVQLFWSNYILETKNKKAFVPLIIICVLLFFIKINTSYISIFLYYLFLFVYFKLNSIENKFKIVISSVIPLAIFLLSFIININIVGYVVGGLNVINNYNDAMNVAVSDSNEYLLILSIALIVLILFLIIHDNIKEIMNNYLLSFNIISFSVFSYVLFKQTYVRAYEVNGFFSLFPSSCFLIYLFTENKYKSIIATTTTSICFVVLISNHSIGWVKVRERVKNPISYCKSLFLNDDSNKIFYAQVKNKSLPFNIKDQIGNKTIDIFPWDLSCLILNKLNYSPRPVFQSYKPYNSYLLDKNKLKFISINAPEFVILSTDAIDNRYHMFDDSDAKLELLKKYSCVDIYRFNDNTNILLKKNSKENNINIKNAIHFDIKMNEYFNLPESKNFTLAKASIKLNLLGKLRRILYQPAEINIELVMEDGSSAFHKAILPVLQHGVVLNPYISDPIDFAEFVNNSNQKLGKKVVKIKFVTTSNSYSDDIKLEISEISSTKNSKNPLNTVLEKIKSINSNYKLIGWIDNLIVKNNSFYINGWAAVHGENSINSKKFIVLESDKNKYKGELKLLDRNDVTKHLKIGNLDESGFYGLINFDSIEKGIYKIGIQVEKGGKSGISYFGDKTIEIK